MDILKIVFAGIITALLYSLIKQIKPEIAPLVLIGGCLIILLAAVERTGDVAGNAEDIINLAGLDSGNVTLLIKALAVCTVTQLAADICRDNSCSSIASAVETAGRLSVILIAMPMLRSVAGLALGLIT